MSRLTFDDWVRQNSDEYGLDVAIPQEQALNFARTVWAAATVEAARRLRGLEDGPDCGEVSGYMRAIDEGEAEILDGLMDGSKGGAT